MRRLMIPALLCLATIGSVKANEYISTPVTEERGFSSGVVTEGGKIVWVSGQLGRVDQDGNTLAGDFEGQARAIFRTIDGIVQQAGGSIADVVAITVYLTDPRLLEPLIPIRHEFWPDGNFPSSTTITVHSLPGVTDMLEISAIAVLHDD